MGTGRGGGSGSGGGGSGSGGGSGTKGFKYRSGGSKSSILSKLTYSFGKLPEDEKDDLKNTLELVLEVISLFDDSYFDDVFLSDYVESLYKELFTIKSSFDFKDIKVLSQNFGLTIDQPGFIVDLMASVKAHYISQSSTRQMEQTIEIANSTFDKFLLKVVGDDLGKIFSLNFKDVIEIMDVKVLSSISGYFLSLLIREAFMKDIRKIDSKKEIYLLQVCEVIANHLIQVILIPKLGKTQITYNEMFTVFREEKIQLRKILKDDEISI